MKVRKRCPAMGGKSTIIIYSRRELIRPLPENPQMTDAPDTGTPFPAYNSAPVDAWSQAVFDALHDWPIAQDGEWTRWEPGYLLLTITRFQGGQVEPVYLWTADEELTVAFGYWESDNPYPSQPWDTDPVPIAASAKALVEQWFDGDLRTAVFTDASGQWCGSISIERGDLAAQLKAFSQEIQHCQPTHVEVRTPAKDGWRNYAVEPDWLGQ
jgi:hypothetical protein